MVTTHLRPLFAFLGFAPCPTSSPVRLRLAFLTIDLAAILESGTATGLGGELAARGVAPSSSSALEASPSPSSEEGAAGDGVAKREAGASD